MRNRKTLARAIVAAICVLALTAVLFAFGTTTAFADTAADYSIYLENGKAYKNGTDEELTIDAVNPDAWDGTVDTSWYNTADRIFEIKTPAQLAGLAAIVNGTASGIEQDSFLDKVVNLSANVDLGGLEWTPIGVSESAYFAGTFYGNGHTVSGMYISGLCNYAGLFGYLSGANVQYVVAENVLIDTTSYGYYYAYAGGIAGYSKNSTINSCFVSGSISSEGMEDYRAFSGGIAGYGNSDSSVVNCGSNAYVYAYAYSTADMSVYSGAGGIVGDNDGDISNCYAAGTPEAASSGTYADKYIGGIASMTSGTLSNCYWNGANIADAFGYASGTQSDFYSFDASGNVSDGRGKLVDLLNNGAAASYLPRWATESGVNDGLPMLVMHMHNGNQFGEELTSAGTISAIGSYYLAGDLTIDTELRITGNSLVTLCLNGHTLYLTSSSNSGDIIVDYGSKLEICDCTGHGKIVETSTTEYNFSISNDGRLMLEGGTLLGFGISNNSSGLLYINGANVNNVDNKGTIYILDGTFTDPEPVYSGYSESMVFISGGVFTGGGEYDIYTSTTAFAYASNYVTGQTESYFGDVVRIYTDMSEGEAVVSGVGSNNKYKFKVTNEGYYLSFDNIYLYLTKHNHSWASEWTSDEAAHWHECDADGCDVTDNSLKDGYELHIAESDDGNCLTEQNCEACGAIAIAAKLSHADENDDGVCDNCQTITLSGSGDVNDPYIVYNEDQLKTAMNSTANDINYIELSAHTYIYGNIEHTLANREMFLNMNNYELCFDGGILILQGRATLQNGVINTAVTVGHDVTLDNVTVETTQNQAVYVYGTVTDLKVVDCEFVGANYGIYIEGNTQSVALERVVLTGGTAAYYCGNTDFTIDGELMAGTVPDISYHTHYDLTYDCVCDYTGCGVEIHEYTYDCDTVCNINPDHTREVFVNHVYEDDHNCTTDVICQSCQDIIIYANPEHIYDNDCDHYCNVDGCTAVYRITEHITEGEDGDCTTDILCINCGEVLKEGNLYHIYYYECDRHCKSEGCTAGDRNTDHVYENDGHDCTTDVSCVYCGEVAVYGNYEHVYDNDCDPDCNAEGCRAGDREIGHLVEIGYYDCTIDRECVYCGEVLVVARDEHEFGEDGCCLYCDVYREWGTGDTEETQTDETEETEETKPPHPDYDDEKPKDEDNTPVAGVISVLGIGGLVLGGLGIAGIIGVAAVLAVGAVGVVGVGVGVFVIVRVVKKRKGIKIPK